MSEADQSGELLDWTSAEVHNEFVDGALLVVRGETPVPMRVEFHPLPIGVAPEEYQGIELRGWRERVGPEVVTPFTVEAKTSDLPRGTVGFELIGATMRAFFPPQAN
jgi:hypothetical protein